MTRSDYAIICGDFGGIWADNPNERYWLDWLKRRTRQMFRVKGVSWWEQEMPDEDEYAEAVRNLEHVGYKVDYIITHCAPTNVQQKLNPDFTPDPLTDFLEKIREKTDYHY